MKKVAIRYAPIVLLIVGSGARLGDDVEHSLADSLHVLTINPDKHKATLIGIPRDSWVEIPGHGTSKINAANQIGGPALTLATVRALTGLHVDHVVVVDFQGFRKLIDAIGGIEITVPKPILSNPFDCPHPPERCKTWK